MNEIMYLGTIRILIKLISTLKPVCIRQNLFQILLRREVQPLYTY